MGKLKELLDEYKKVPEGSARESEIKKDIDGIVEWMKSNGYMDKPFKLPRKNRKNKLWWTDPFNPADYEDGNYCSHEGCWAAVTEEDIKKNRCPKCDWGLGCVMFVSHPKDLNKGEYRV